MAEDPRPSSNLWGYVAFQEALEGARATGVVNDDAELAVFQRGFLAAWDRMEQAAQDGQGWPPADERQLHRVAITLKWLEAAATRWRNTPEGDEEAAS